MSDGRDTSKSSKKGSAHASSVGDSYDAPFRGYININLDDTQKAAFDGWCEGGAAWELLAAAVEDGVHLSVKRDGKGTGFLASATQRRVGSPNAGLVVTARANEPAKAWLRLLFLLAVLSRTPRWEDVKPIADPDHW